jgi:hypothetical protein
LPPSGHHRGTSLADKQFEFRTHLGLSLKEVVSQNTKTIKKGICDEAVKYEQSIRGKALGRRTK